MILLPTLNRIDLLRQFLQSTLSTEMSTPGMILVDGEDLNDHLAEYQALELPKDWEIVNTARAVSMGDKVRQIWPRLKDCKWVGLLNDDHYCVTPQWDKKAEALLDGTNMLSTNDGGWNFGVRVVGLTAWSMPLLEAAGFPVFPRNLQHLYIDDAWKAIGESTGCWLETNKVNIEHRHVYNGKMEQDATFGKVNSAQSWEYDAKEFRHFMEQDFKGVCERILKLRSEQTHKAKFG